MPLVEAEKLGERWNLAISGVVSVYFIEEKEQNNF